MGKIYLVHCVDTEGPLNESLVATFERIYALTGVKLRPSLETLKKIQRKEIDLNGHEDIAAYVFCERFLHYNRNWAEIERMLDLLTDNSFRQKYADSEGNGWQYNWFIVDLADFILNPRDRVMGYHNVWDHYKEYYEIHDIRDDEFQWHAHPMSTYFEANRCATSYINSPHIIQSLARGLIDRGFFPSCFRPGYDTERPDSHWLLEQYIPFDFANQAVEPDEKDIAQRDQGNGRFGDWRRATTDWTPYHPAHDDYQVSGTCNRVIFRCLNIGTRVRNMTQKEVDKAFAAAAEGNNVLISFADHDFRYMVPDIQEMYDMLQTARKKYPAVKWVNSKAHEAAKAVLNLDGKPLNLSVDICEDRGQKILSVKTDQDTFGPQPFLAFKLKSGRYYVDNFDFQVPRREWSYVFDFDSVHFEDIEAIGIASSSLCGSGALKVIDMQNEILAERTW